MGVDVLCLCTQVRFIFLGGGLGCLVSTLLSPSDLYLEANPRNITSLEVDLKNVLTKDEFRAPYHVIYCVGAVTAAMAAVVYFFLYHCCLKKRCFAPLYRNDHNGVAAQGDDEKCFLLKFILPKKHEHM